ncbi:MAG: rhodanese-like domain-containing protein [Gammaproteobacteria bacterium]|nr:rhodanese-like domain-containing protein [Gammaproteobacteria bacterium]
MVRFIEFSANHPILVGITAMALATAVFIELQMRGRSGRSVAPARAVMLINQGATVVDVRQKASFDDGHIVDAIHLEGSELVAKADSQLKKKRAVILVCDSGTQSTRLVDGLRKAGYENSWSLEGGLAAWRRDNLPVIASRKGA